MIKNIIHRHRVPQSCLFMHLISPLSEAVLIKRQALS